MRLLLLAGIFAATVAPALAEPPSFGADRIVSVATGDVNRDGEPDAVMLIAPADAKSDADNGLLVLLGEGGENTVQFSAFVRDFVWGDMIGYGRRPSVTIDQRGSVLVNAHNDAIGRDRWTETLTLAWRDGGLVVAGYTYRAYDTLEPDHTSSCDLNLLTGRGTKEQRGRKSAVAIKAAKIAITDWPGGAHDDPCGLNGG